MRLFGRREKGQAAEDAAARHLLREGFTVVDRNARSKLGEVDIVAVKADEVHFIEVRSRSEGSPVSPRETIGAGKRRRFDLAAESYLRAKRLASAAIRYDVAEVWLDAEGRPTRVELLVGAFGGRK